MKFNLIPFKLPAFSLQANRNEAQLAAKSEPKTHLKPELENQVVAKNLFDTGWVSVTPEPINGAYTQVEGLELPQTVKYGLDFTLNVPEIFLPFINVSVMAKPIDLQKIIGASQFTYTSLREVLITLYDWMGVTQTIQGLGQVGGFTPIPISSPNGSLPAYSLVTPPPAACYSEGVYYVQVRAPLIGTGIGPYPVTPDGLFLPTVNQTLAQWTQSLADTYFPGNPNPQTQILFDIAQSYTFIHNPINFPLPEGEDFPCGSTSGFPGYPNQRWEANGIVNFQGYMTIEGITYAQAKAVFTQYYPEIFITPFALGPPWKAYRPIITDTVESGNHIVKIVKTGNEDFQFGVYGNILLVSPSVTETDFSDPVFPTYQPEGGNLLVRVVASFKDHPVNFNTTKAYRK